MRHNRFVITLSILVVAVLAAVSGALLPSGESVYAANPMFGDGTTSRSVAENTPAGVNIGAPISATDPDEDALEYGNTLKYSLGGTDAASFDIDASTGQLITKAPLDHESDPSYSVTVMVDDGETRGEPVRQNVNISVGDVNEPPDAPDAPTVVSGPDTAGTDVNESSTSLRVVWHEPDNKGRPDITGYAVQYKKSTEHTFYTVDSLPGGLTEYTITGLEADTSYQVRVWAKNEESPADTKGPWSLVGTGSTNKASNSPPFITSRNPPLTLTVNENESTGRAIGSPVSATETDSSSKTYGLAGPNASLFSIDTSSGQIRTKAPLNHENPDCASDSICEYAVTVTVSDGDGGTDAMLAKIRVSDTSEPPSKPGRPTVRATQNSSTSLDVSWTAPTNTGPPITRYDVRYRKGGSSETFQNLTAEQVKGTTATISPVSDPLKLKPDTSYQVQVRAHNYEGPSAYSDSGSGKTAAANSPPIFQDRTDDKPPGNDFTAKRSVSENTRAGQPIGTRVAAADQDGDSLTYKLVAAEGDGKADDYKKFAIDASTGQLRTKAPLNHEDLECGYATEDSPTSCTYSVKVEVRDGLNIHRVKEAKENPTPDDVITVEIAVTDVSEKPAAPSNITVTSPSMSREGNNVTASLKLVWDVPQTTGPPITAYEVQYRKGSSAWTPKTDTPASENAAVIEDMITGLDADSSYSLRVRAKPASEDTEGVGEWSRTLTVKTNKSTNTPPAFPDDASESLSVAENSSSGAEVGSVTAGPDNDSSTLTYSIEGGDASLFRINSSSGQISVRSALNHEDPACGYDSSAGDSATCSYNVRVKVSDGEGGSDYHLLEIRVTDVDEPLPKLTAPRVTATTGSGWSLDVTWDAPNDSGKPPVTGYVIQYRENNSGSWQTWSHTGTGTSATITTLGAGENAPHLTPNTQYEVQVRAKNDETAENAANWSQSGRGTTGSSNKRPEFGSVGDLSVPENTPSGRSVGSAVSATDLDGNRLTYSIEGPGADSFTINSSTGQISTKSALDYEKRSSYSLTVKVDDGSKRANSVAFKSAPVTVTDVAEAPSAPTAPTVAGIPGSTTSVRVTWDKPANTGPPITDYNVQYREVGGSGFKSWHHDGRDRSAIITGLTAGTRYEVQVFARNAEGYSEYSSAGTGSPNADATNRNPAFSPGAVTLSVPENTAPLTDVGTPIRATDQDGDPLTYSLEGTDESSFNILSTSAGGQIQTSAALNHEAKSSYSVTVRVKDGRGGTDSVNVTINVTDVAGEAPGVPSAPTVQAISSSSLQVTWSAPPNAGPPITDYDYRYRSTGSWTEVTNTTITNPRVVITSLTSSTSYDVEVRANNAEGSSDWSSPGSGSTTAAGANNPPVFTEGSSSTRDVSATAPAGTLIGAPVTATDADSGDTLTYSLSGSDSASFGISSATGQLLTKAGVTLTVGTTYNVNVEVSDGAVRATIAIAITATAGPPNSAPVFTDGSSTTRRVFETASAGSTIGSPVSATDADSGDSLLYSLEGTDAASFGIRTNTGQLLTKAALDASAKSTYSVTVVVSDGKAQARIDVTITVSAGPVTYGCATRGAVTDTSNLGLVADCEALLRSRDALEGSARLLNWSATVPIRLWTGVYRSGTPERVTRLILRGGANELYGGKLQGTLPSELSGVTMLVELNLRSNDLTGSIPSEIGNLRNLRKLLLHNNQLTGSFPNLSGLTNLTHLWLSGSNQNVGVGGGIPTWLNGLTKLEELNLWGNEMGGSIPTMSGMSSLKLLKLQNNSLTGTIPSWFGSMDSLAALYLHNNSLSGSIPLELGRLTRLRRMWLDRNQLTGTIPPELGNMSNLGTLNLHSNQLTGAIPPALGRLSRLQHFALHNNQLVGPIPPELGSLLELTRLWVSNNNLTGSIPSELRNLTKLRSLNLRANGLTGQFPSGLADLGANPLTHLRLSGNDLAGCVPTALVGATDATDLLDAGPDLSQLPICTN